MANKANIKMALSICARPIAFQPALSKMLGNDIGAALFLQQIIYWSDKGEREDGLVYKSDREIEEETTLSPRQSARIRKLLRVLGILNTQILKAPNGSPTNHYSLNWNTLLKRILDFYKLSESSITEKTTEKKAAPSKEGAAPLSPKRVYKNNATVERLMDYWNGKCEAELGRPPAFNSGAGYKRISDALKKGFSADEVEEIINEWFAECYVPEKQIQITEALSDKKLLSFRARNAPKRS
jgi:hypothetical protein